MKKMLLMATLLIGAVSYGAAGLNLKFRKTVKQNYSFGRYRIRNKENRRREI